MAWNFNYHHIIYKRTPTGNKTEKKKKKINKIWPFTTILKIYRLVWGKSAFEFHVKLEAIFLIFGTENEAVYRSDIISSLFW